MSDQAKPLITIGIACFDAADTIARAIRSARQQDWPSLEILVVDDGSNDGSPEIVEGIARDDDHVRLVRHPGNLGTAQTRTTIVENATGEFLVFFDDDDESDPTRVERQFARIVAYESESSARLVACYTSRVTVRPDASRSHVSCIGHRPKIPHGPLVLDYLLLHEIAPGYTYGEMGSGTLMARRSTFEAVGPFDAEFRRCAEWDWAVRLAFMDGHFIGVDAPLLTQHVTRTTDKAGRLPLHYALLLRHRNKAYLSRMGLYRYARVMAHLRFYYAKKRNILFRLCLMAGFLLAPRRMWRHVRAYRKVKA